MHTNEELAKLRAEILSKNKRISEIQLEITKAKGMAAKVETLNGEVKRLRERIEEEQVKFKKELEPLKGQAIKVKTLEAENAKLTK